MRSLSAQQKLRNKVVRQTKEVLYFAWNERYFDSIANLTISFTNGIFL